MWDQRAMQFRKVVVSAIVIAIVIVAYDLAPTPRVGYSQLAWRLSGSARRSAS
jgi:hypothetical protein